MFPLPPRQRQLIYLAVLLWAAALVTGCGELLAPGSPKNTSRDRYLPMSLSCSEYPVTPIWTRCGSTNRVARSMNSPAIRSTSS